MHHPGVQATGHGERFEVAPQGHGQRELVHQVHGRAGHHRPAAQVLQAQHLGKERKPRLVHVVQLLTTGQPARLPAFLPQDLG